MVTPFSTPKRVALGLTALTLGLIAITVCCALEESRQRDCVNRVYSMCITHPGGADLCMQNLGVVCGVKIETRTLQ